MPGALSSAGQSVLNQTEEVTGQVCVGGNKVNEREGSAEGGCPGRDGLEAGLKSKDRLEPINCKHE